MEEKKLDVNSIIGFVLIFLIVVWIFYNNYQNEAKEVEEKAKVEQVQTVESSKESLPTKEVENPVVSDSLQQVLQKNALGSFAYAANLPSAKNPKTTILENELLWLEFSNKGGYLIEAKVKNF